MSNRKKVRRLVGLTTLNLIFLAICIVTLVPILYAVTLSLSGSGGALSSGLTFIPETPTLDNYRAILLEEPAASPSAAGDIQGAISLLRMFTFGK